MALRTTGLPLGASLVALAIACAGALPACSAEVQSEVPDESAQDEALGALPGAARYPRSRTQAPITTEMVARWATTAARAPSRKADVFSKIGDSQTVNAGFMHCEGEYLLTLVPEQG
ncbi:MAG: hypothetical protein IPF92_12490 [Myxococcales bacterium]|jgi:hypothetical protein|nr:hypothetical protein [Myxococcales bacterium]MBL0197577.1 hypothetical protein [Myxococcales bacterium]HQY60917.1 hypothetical protein [Polyangiaceae bacterium]